ncbi:MAG: hypothetical protein ABSB63_04675 [Spirochaetia bacterium]|jgi:hypothetical protein
MRTACSVTLLLLVSMCGAVFAQEKADDSAGALDRDVTVVGRDDTALPVPPPGTPQDITIPDVDPEQPRTSIVPPIQPPPDARTSRSVDQGVIDQPGDSFP